MIIHSVSDLHGYEPELPGGDILIIAGDCTASDTYEQWEKFASYLRKAPYEDIILVAGNHDGALEAYEEEILKLFDLRVQYLCDREVNVQCLRIYGSPWTPIFYAWHFQRHREELDAVWEHIPSGLDILVTHGPPFGILDKIDKQRCGDQALAQAVDRAKPKHHVFGHIHAGYGTYQDSWGMDGTTTKYYNVSMCDEKYRLTNAVTTITV